MLSPVATASEHHDSKSTLRTVVLAQEELMSSLVFIYIEAHKWSKLRAVVYNLHNTLLLLQLDTRVGKPWETKFKLLVELPIRLSKPEEDRI